MFVHVKDCVLPPWGGGGGGVGGGAALPHIHELVSGIAAYTYTSSRVNVSSAAFTVQVVAVHSKAFFR